jgi:hypothetical protein
MCAIILAGQQTVMDERNNAEKEKPPEQVAFTEALSLALSVSKKELQDRLSQSEPEPVSRHARYKFVPSKPRP